MNIWIIIKIIYLSYDKEEFKRLLFSGLGIALGVILFTAIRISTDNIKESVDASESFLGNNIVNIISDSGDIPENTIRKISTVPGIKMIVPMSKKSIQVTGVNGQQDFTVIGIDIIKMMSFSNITASSLVNVEFQNYLKYLSTSPIHVFVSQKIKDSELDNTLELDVNGIKKEVIISDVIPQNIDPIGINENKIIMDIHNFQNLFTEYNSVNEIKLQLYNPDDKHVISAIKAQLPPTIRIVSNDEKSSFLNDITSTFRFNLNFLIVLTLLVTGVMTYNSISYYILERRHEFGLLMMLGARPRNLVVSVLIASIVISVLCTIGGIFVGYWIAKLLIGMITQTISNIYFPISISQIYVDTSLIIAIFLITTVMTLVACIIPCYEIYQIALRETIAYQTYEKSFKKQIQYITALGVGLLVVSLLCITKPILALDPQIAFIAMVGIMLSIAFFQPVMLDLFLRFSELTIGKYFFAATFAAEHVRSTMRKNVVAISAISMAIALCAICFIIIDSTKKSVLEWVNHINSADVYINSADSYSINEYLPENVLATVKAMPEVRSYNIAVFKDIIYKSKPVRLQGANFDTLPTENIIKLTTEIDNEKFNAIISDPSNVFISDRTAKEFKLKEGDELSIPINKGNYLLKVAGIYYNYSSDRNFILINRFVFAKIYDQPNIQQAVLYLHDSSQKQAIVKQLKDKFSNKNIIIMNNEEMRMSADNIVRQAFSIGDVILIVTLVAAIITLFSTLEELIISRVNEFTIFWAIGASDLQIIKMCFWESFLICCAAIINAIIPTIILIYIMFFYINKLFFGTDVFLYIPFMTGFLFVIFLFAVGLLAGLIPALKMKKLMNTGRLKYE